MRSSKMYNNAVVGAGPARAPRCKAAGVILIVFGILEFFVFIFSVVAGTGGSTSAVAGWWVYLLSSAGMITTGSLAVAAASNGKPYGVAVGAIVMASLTLAWIVVKLIILLIALVAMIAATAAVNSAELTPETQHTENTVLGIVWAVLAVVTAFTITSFVCLICIIVAVSKVTCYRSTQDQAGIVINEQPPAREVVYPPRYNQYNQPC